MPNARYELTGEYVQVKQTGNTSTMRINGAVAHLVEAAAKPAADAVSFPMYETDPPFTFSADTSVWAKGSGTVNVIDVATE